MYTDEILKILREQQSRISLLKAVNYLYEALYDINKRLKALEANKEIRDAAEKKAADNYRERAGF